MISVCVPTAAIAGARRGLLNNYGAGLLIEEFAIIKDMQLLTSGC